ncbi:MAG: TIGR02677 family protein [Actinobacteria bacterium]|nr:TIGR02677 family protein [Actinomycetota bacterium]
MDVFSYLTVEKADVYRAVMGTFVAAKEQFRLHLRARDLATDLALDDDAVRAALTQLVEWGNLRRDVDTAEVATVEEFNRPRYLYQLTAEGQAAERAVRHFEDTLLTPGELQTTALTDIADLLRELVGLAGQQAPDAGKVHLTLRSLADRFEELTDRAQTFIVGLQRTVELHEIDLDAFLAYKDRLIDYLERFIGDLVTAQATIAALLTEIEAAGAGRLLTLAAERELSDALDVDDEDRAATTRDRWDARWRGLTAWFVAPPGQASQSDVLRARARKAVPDLLRAVSQINERRVSRTDRAADLRTLARWFAEAESDADAHRLWRAAFGLTSARHLAVDADTLDARDDDPVASSTSWLDDEPLRISPQLRKTGRYIRRGMPKAVIDRSREKALLAAQAEREAAQAAAARRRLATGGRTRLSVLGDLDRAAFDLFLDLLGEALATKVDPHETVEATTADGSMHITLTPTGDGATATIRTADGDLHGEDHHVTIVDLVAGDTAPDVGGSGHTEEPRRVPVETGA